MPVAEIKEVPQPLPPALLDCAPEPARPTGELPGGRLSDVQVSLLFADVLEAGRDCRGKLGQVRALVKPE